MGIGSEAKASSHKKGEKKMTIVSVRMRIKDINGTTLSETKEYGMLIGNRTIKIEDRYFHAGRKAGFGKTNCIYERENGQFHKVIIDRIERIA